MDLNPEISAGVDDATEVFFVAVGRDNDTGVAVFGGIVWLFKPNYFAIFSLAVFFDADVTMSALRFGDDGFVAGFRQELLPTFSVEPLMRLALRPVTGGFEDFPSAVASGVFDDEIALIGDKRVVAGGVIFFPVGEFGVTVRPGVSVEIIVHVLILLGSLARMGRFPVLTRGATIKHAVEAPE